jgi:molybdopterin biosynthesis enzyme
VVVSTPPYLPAMAPHRYPMISMPEAQDIVLSRVPAALPPEEVLFTQAVGRLLAADVVARAPHPPFAASVMDGYAVRAADCPGTLVVTAAARAAGPPPLLPVPETTRQAFQTYLR